MAIRFPLAPFRRASTFIRTRSLIAWRWYRARALWLQIVIGIAVVVGLLAFGSFLSHLGTSTDGDSSIPTVTLAEVGALSGNTSSVGIIGTVRSMSEADLLAQSGGTVTAVHTRVGATVPAGFVLAELDNASQRAAVLQAEGAYDAAVAAKSGASPTDIATSALNTYTSAYSSLDTTLKTYIDAFYGEPGAQGPKFLIGSSPFDFSYFPLKRAHLAAAMSTWRTHLASASSTTAPALLDEADSVTREASSLASDIAITTNRYDTDASASQLAGLATARASIASIQASITAAKQSYKSGNSSSTLGVDATVKSALGALRAAQANLEKTLVRAPIGGTVNFFPIRVGDYVTALTHVATVAQNGALEVVSYVSEDDRTLLAAGTPVKIEGTYSGTVTSIAPALDPVTKQIEVHMAVSGTTALVNGQSVHIALPGAPKSTTATSTGPLYLPLTALKLTPSARVVFSLGADGRLVSHAVDIGDVRGDRIEVLTALPADLRIVTDARGLSDGQKVNIAQ